MKQLYVRSQGRFVAYPEKYYPTAKGSRAGFVTEDSVEGDLLIELKYGGETVSKINFETDMEIEFLHSDGSGSSQQIDVAPVVVSLPVNERYGGDNFQISVYQISEQGEKLRELFKIWVADWN